MFATIGRIADRHRYVFLFGWIALAVIITLVAPNLDDVTDNDQGSFLPEDAPSIAAEELIANYFPTNVDDGTTVIVFESADEQPVTEPASMAYINDVSVWLLSDEGPGHIKGIVSPTLNPEAAGNLIAPDGQLGMIVVSLNTSNLNERNETLDATEAYLADAPSSLHVYRTGESAIFKEYNEILTESVDRTIFVTLFLVIIILLAIYRSPISPLIPLGVVTVAFMIARGVVAWLGQSVFTVSDTATMLLIVVMYGAGTDYCLFLISRFREEMADHHDSRPAVRSTVRHVGESISSSAGTVVTGFMAMALAQLGLFNTTGPTLAIGVIVSLLAGLTLTPALLGILGKWAFWPARPQHRATGALYKRTSQWVSERPLLTIVGITLLMAPLAYHGSGMRVTYDFLADLPDDTESVEGFRALETHIGAGEMQPLTAVAVFEDGNLLANVSDLTAELESVEGVATIRSATQPFGGHDETTVNLTRLDRQLGALAMALTPAESAEAPTDEQLAVMQALIADLPAYLTLAAERAPEIAQYPAFDATLNALAALAESGEMTPDLAANLGELAAQAPPVHIELSVLPAGVSTVFGGEMMAGFVGSFLNPTTQAARFEIVLTDTPYSLAAMDTVEKLQGIFEAETDEGAIAGSTAVNADIRDYLRTDQRMTIALVMVGIFLILMVMLRSIVAPIYLIGTILLSYGTTLGITRYASDILWGTDELTWWVPFFMFVFLVALGIDYSIFLFGRIKEEVGRQGIHDGIHHAVESTGSIITSAGIIVAGTFGAMMAGSILGLAQIGFAVSIGILIDTFVVRTILDPALASFFGRWTWWPGGVAIGSTSSEDRSPSDSDISPRRPLPEVGGAD